MKIVVFDLDETLGYFTQYGIFWDSLSNYIKVKNKNKLTQADFDDVLDLFPDVLRPNIIHILNYLKSKKKTNCCNKMLIYTNNTGPREWARHIIGYFEEKIK
jgi:acetaldehyde dehydrogenase (acetylating)